MHLSPAAVADLQGTRRRRRCEDRPVERRAAETIIGDYDGLAVRSATKVTRRRAASRAKRLKVIGRAGIGVDNIDIPAATAAGIIVMNTPFGNSITTAEHAIALMLALARDIPAANASTHAGKWEKNRFMGVELYGKTLGLIGCGNIGSIVADRAKGLQDEGRRLRSLSVAGARQPISASRRSSSTSCCARADFISLHTPLTDETATSSRADAIAKMKKGVRIDQLRARRTGRRGALSRPRSIPASSRAPRSTCSRGAGEDEHAVRLRAAWSSTPHLGASTTEAQENVALQVAEQISDYPAHGRDHERAQHAVDHGRGSAAHAAVDLARRKARRLRRPAHRDAASTRSRSSTKARAAS